MILNALALKLKRQAQGDFRGRHFEAILIVQAVSWYLRYALSYRDIEQMLLERGMEVDHSTINRWVLTYAPLAGLQRAASRRGGRMVVTMADLAAATDLGVRAALMHPLP